MVRRAAVLLALGLATTPAAAMGQTFTVTDTGDLPDGTPGDGLCAAPPAGTCTLRAAVQEANATAGADTVVLPAGTFTLSIGGTGENAAATGDLDVTDALTVQGAGAGATVVDAAGIDRVFDVPSPGTGVSLALNGLTLRGGAGGSTDGSAVQSRGPALSFADAELTADGGRSVVVQFGPAGSTFSMVRTNVHDNTVGGASSRIVDTTSAQTTLADTTFTHDVVASTGGFSTLFDFDPVFDHAVALSIQRSSFASNTITGDSEGLVDVDPSAGSSNPVGLQLSVADSAFSDNQTATTGGYAVFQLDPCGGASTQNPVDATFARDVFARNTSGPQSSGGGAIYWGPCQGNGATQTLAIRDSDFTGNIAGTSGFGRGGAIDFEGPSDAALDISGSTFSGNSAGGPAPGGSGSGGAIGVVNGVASILNSTFTGNQVPVSTGSFTGGGAIELDNGTLTVRHSTIAGNVVGSSAPGGGGGGIMSELSPPDGLAAGPRAAPPAPGITVTSSILFGNKAGGLPNDCGGTPPTSGGTNIEGSTSCAFKAAGDRQSTDPLLSALADNGGPTPTMAIADTSPAKDAAAAASCPATDQRGVARPQFAGCDIGAFELAPPPPAGQQQGGATDTTGSGGGGGATTTSAGGQASGAGAVVKPAKLGDFVRLPAARKCVSRRDFRIRLRAPAGVTVTVARVFVNGRRVAVRRGSRLTAPVDLRGFVKGRFTVKIVIRLADGRTVSGQRRYRTCTKKQRGGHVKV